MPKNDKSGADKKSGGKKRNSVKKAGGSAVVRRTGKVAKLAANPVVAEVVAATLVAAAAALRSPDKARALAESARDELGALGKDAAAKGSPFWQLALDVAQKSMDSIAGDNGKKKRAKSKK